MRLKGVSALIASILTSSIVFAQATEAGAGFRLDQEFGRQGKLITGVGQSQGFADQLKLTANAPDGHIALELKRGNWLPYRQITQLDNKGEIKSGHTRRWMPDRRGADFAEPLANGGTLVAGGRWIERIKPNGLADRTFDGDGRVELSGPVKSLAALPDGSFFVVTRRGSFHTTVEGFSSSGQLRFKKPQRWEEIEFLDRGLGGSATVLAYDMYWDYGIPISVARQRVGVLGQSGKLRLADGRYDNLKFKPGGFVALNIDHDRLQPLDSNLTVSGEPYDLKQNLSCDTEPPAFPGVDDYDVDSKGRTYAMLSSYLSAEGCGILRFLADGSPDTDFGGVIPFEYSSLPPADLAVDARDRLLVARESGGRKRASVVRYLDSGSIDTGFGRSGVAGVGFPLPNQVRGKVFSSILPDGGILIATRSVGLSGSAGDRVLVFKYRSDGSLVRSFGTGGVARLKLGRRVDIRDMAIAPDGRIAFAARQGSHARVFALEPDGDPDLAFGNSGSASLPVELADRQSAFQSLAIDDAGRIVAGGRVATSKYHRDWLIARFERDGSTDYGFGKRGVVTLDIGKSKGSVFANATSDDDLVSEIAFDARERIVLAGISAPQGSGADLIVGRLRTGGGLDPTFGSRGIYRREYFLRAPWFAFSARPTDLAISSEGQIAVSNGWQGDGKSHGYEPFNEGAVVLLDPDGRPVRSFGRQGTSMIRDLTISGIRFDRCGRIIAAGSYYAGNYEDDFGLTRIGTDGIPDAGPHGKIMRIRSGVERKSRGWSLAADRKGRVYVAGKVLLPSLNSGVGVASVRLGLPSRCTKR